MSGRHRADEPDDSGSRRPLAFAAAAVVLVVALGVGGWFWLRPADSAPVPDPVVTTAESAPTLTADELQASFDELKLRVPTGVAVVPVGGGEPLLVGDQRVQDAWSTIKAPLGLAAERKHGMSRTEMNAVIDSDNASARVLTRSLGSPVDAQRELAAVLREGGDTATRPARRHGSDYPMLGETRWALADSAVWTGNLPCLSGSDHILELMRDVAEVQEWGLRRIGDDTPVKGGWGEAPDGGYVVRQIGVVTMSDGTQAAVSVSTHEPGMTFEKGTRTLDRVANWLQDNLDGLPSGTCR